MVEITDPDKKIAIGFESDERVFVDTYRGPGTGLSYAVYEEDDTIFNKRLREYVEKKDYRYAATAIRDEPERLDRSTRELIAQALEAAAILNPAHRPRNMGSSKADKRNRIIRQEAEELAQQGFSAQKINEIQLIKYGPGSGYDPPIGDLNALRKARKSIPIAWKRIFDSINKK